MGLGGGGRNGEDVKAEVAGAGAAITELCCLDAVTLPFLLVTFLLLLLLLLLFLFLLTSTLRRLLPPTVGTGALTPNCDSSVVCFFVRVDMLAAKTVVVDTTDTVVASVVAVAEVISRLCVFVSMGISFSRW